MLWVTRSRTETEGLEKSGKSCSDASEENLAVKTQSSWSCSSTEHPGSQDKYMIK